MENNQQGTWLGSGNLGFEPIFTQNTYELVEGNYCIGHGRESITIDDLVYSIVDYDCHNGPRPHEIDAFIDIGAIESPYVKNLIAGLDEPANYFSLFPVPVADKLLLRISSQEIFGLDSFEIITADGRLIKRMTAPGNRNVYKIDVSDLKDGLYILKINNSKGPVSLRFIKE